MKITVLGCGSIGLRHLRNLRALGHEVIPFDPSPDARLAVEQEFSTHCADELNEVWTQEPEVAFVTAPTDRHLPVALEAARHDCHLFIEKPLSHTLDAVDALAGEVARRGLVVMVGCNMRFHPGPASIKRCLEEGNIGTVIAARIQAGSYLPDWRPRTDYHKSYSASAAQGGGVVLDCIHEIDLAFWYFGSGNVVAAVCLPATPLGLSVEGLAEILIRHDSGVISSVHLNFVQRDYRRCCQVIGSEGSIYWDFSEPNVRHCDSERNWRTIAQAGDWVTNQMFLDEAAHFLSCVRAGCPSSNDLESASRTLRAALDAKAASNCDTTDQTSGGACTARRLPRQPGGSPLQSRKP
jgi:predicted dehydrogenase